jgi:hypothetical protein
MRGGYCVLTLTVDAIGAQYATGENAIRRCGTLLR